MCFKQTAGTHQQWQASPAPVVSHFSSAQCWKPPLVQCTTCYDCVHMLSLVVVCRIRHCRDLLGELAVAYVAASCKADQARTWLELYASAHVLDRLHWSPAAPAAGDLALISHSPSAQQRHQQQQQQQLVVPAPDAAALLARTGHTATAVGSLLVVLGGDMRDGPAPAVSDVLVVDLPSSHLVQPRLHGKQPQSLREHCTVLLNPQAGSALLEQVR